MNTTASSRHSLPRRRINGGIGVAVRA